MINSTSYFSTLSSYFPKFGKTDPKPFHIDVQNKNTLFFDFCAIHYWELKTPEMIETYMNDLMEQLSSAHVNQINLAFAQINNISNLLNETGNFSRTNLFGYIISQNPTLLTTFVEKAHAAGLKVKLSFGGNYAYGQQMRICRSKETPEGQAEKLLQLIEKYKLDGVDLDIEGVGCFNLIQQNKRTLLPFLEKLHELLSAKDYSLSLTTGVNHEVINTLSLLFFDSSGKPQINQFFDGVYLMCYDSGSKYYIDASDDDADNVVWGLKKWMESLPQNQSSLIHIGFQDATPYETPAASAGTLYTIKTKDRGEAASEIYKECSSNLSKLIPSTHLGAPFWWPGEESMQSRYNVDPEGHTDFKVETIKNFYGQQQTSFFYRLYRTFFA